MAVRLTTTVVLFLLPVPLIARNLEVPAPVSPVDTEGIALVEDRCPTFHWGLLPGTTAYELVVYRTEAQELAEPETAPPVLRRELPGSATGWTPSGADCFEAGGRYGWSLRAVAGDGAVSEWSAPSLFEVADWPSVREVGRALAVLQSYLETDGAGRAARTSAWAGGANGAGSGAAPGVVSTNPPLADSSPVFPATAAPQAANGVGDADLKVNDSPVITAATLRLPRRFYVTNTDFTMSTVLTACAVGYHMASMWELLDPSNLVYDFARPDAKTFADSGQGPPSHWYGFVRTGQLSSGSSVAGSGNCLTWSTTDPSHSGVAVRLTRAWETAGELNGVWEATSFACSIIGPVWCVSD